MEKRTPFSVQDVVNKWRSDTHLSVNSKRVAVRHAMTQLVRERVCKRRGGFEFTV
jgi:hypothetical protein